ncbi:Endonuclease/exonuclease/phosphatase_superfamily [Hexamita inflata]|uniref:Endonuclease/exonuclease/phosphatase superfamily n=1 Tax=Hexamita inflata TaxID=28002 RepID=A0AA86RAL8_9EUKA|nr:Endonuclease/exonuclease/phosphatase superfamily [Hexamita inflata]CAI9969049.1 Endonuclease/exonuclease/phosphatase superfamily [Hexamita inflata]
MQVKFQFVQYSVQSTAYNFKFIDQHADLIVLHFQQLNVSESSCCVSKSNFTQYLESIMPSHEITAHSHCNQIHSFVCVKNLIRKLVQVESAQIMNKFGSHYGAVVQPIRFNGKLMLFVNCNLDQKSVSARQKQFIDIENQILVWKNEIALKQIENEPLNPEDLEVYKSNSQLTNRSKSLSDQNMKNQKTKAKKKKSQSQKIFTEAKVDRAYTVLMGNLNCKLSCTAEQINSALRKYTSEEPQSSEFSLYKELKNFDELKNGINDLKEVKITFGPTYPVIKGTTKYQNDKIGWTDRILTDFADLIIKPVYQSVKMEGSDHFPVILKGDLIM